MKITDALISVLRLLVTTDDDRVEPAADRPVPDWVKRVNGGSEADPPHEATSAAPTFASSIAPETAPEHEMVEQVQNAVETEPNVEEEQAVEEEEAVEEAQAVEEEQAVPALLDSLLSWVQARDDEPAPVARIEPEPELELAREPEPAHEFEPEPEPVPEAVSLTPEPVGAATAVSPAVVPVAPDLARLEASAQVAESLNLGFHLGSAVERIASAAAQGSDGAASLREAVWLIERYISIIENRPLGADLHLTAARLARAGDAIAGLKELVETLGETEPEPRPA